MNPNVRVFTINIMCVGRPLKGNEQLHTSKIPKFRFFRFSKIQRFKITNLEIFKTFDLDPSSLNSFCAFCFFSFETKHNNISKTHVTHFLSVSKTSPKFGCVPIGGFLDPKSFLPDPDLPQPDDLFSTSR